VRPRPCLWKCLTATLPSVGQRTLTGTKFNPEFPASCPFVTAVGATQVNPGSTVFEPESACEQVIFSGGGFSNIFSMPDYQKAAVSHFLESHPPPYTAAQYNNSGAVKTCLPCNQNSRFADSQICLLTGQAFAILPFCRTIDLASQCKLCCCS
jgi:hypothetical protein